MTSVNLIPAHRRAKQQARRRRNAWIRGLRIYAILLAVACALTFIPAQAGPPSLESSLARVDRRIESKTKELETLRKQSTDLGRQLDLARAIGEHPDWSALLLAIARCRAEIAVLESIDLSIAKEEPRKDKPGAPTPAPTKPATPPRDIITVKLLGIAGSPAACVQFASALERLELFDRVVVKDTRAQNLGRMNATHFEIEATLASAAAKAAPQGAKP